MTEAAAAVRFEPYMVMQFLPGCRSCGHPHPLATKGWSDPYACPGCGRAAGEVGEPHTEVAELTCDPEQFMQSARKVAP